MHKDPRKTLPRTPPEDATDVCKGHTGERRMMCRVLAHWQALQQDDLPPPVTAFEPSQLPEELAAHLFVLGLREGPRRYPVRYAGARLVDMCGTDPTGRCANDVLPTALREKLPYLCINVVDFGRPLADSGSYMAGSGEILYRKMLMPLWEPEHQRIGHILGCVSFRRAS